MKKDFQIRPWLKEDFLSVKNLLLETWLETFHFIPKNDLIDYSKSHYSIEKLNELFNNNNAYCLSVIVENEVVGWMKLFDNKDENKFYVSSLYVLPKFQGYGIGKELILLAEDKAKQLNYSEVWIGVMEQNVNTLNWYRKLGFNFVSVEPFRMGETEVAHLIGFKPVKS